MLLKVVIIILCIFTLLIQILNIILKSKKNVSRKTKKQLDVLSVIITTSIIFLIFIYSDKPKLSEHSILERMQETKAKPEKIIKTGERFEKETRDKLLSLQFIIVRAYYDVFMQNPYADECYYLLHKYTNEVQEEVEYFRSLGATFLNIADSIRYYGFGDYLDQFNVRDKVFVLDDINLLTKQKLRIYDTQDQERLIKIAQSFNSNDYVNALNEVEIWQNELQTRYDDIVQTRLEAVDIPYFHNKLKRIRWVNYKIDSRVNSSMPLIDAVKRDLDNLVKNGFYGLIVEYSTDRDKVNIGKIAYQAGIKGIIWEVGDPEESRSIDNAYNIREYVDAYYFNGIKYTNDLSNKIKYLRKKTLKPISVSKYYWDYFQKAQGKRTRGIIDILNDSFINQLDFNFVEFEEPYYNTIQLVMKHNRFLGFQEKKKQFTIYRRIPIPSMGEWYTENIQLEIYKEIIENTDIMFAICQAYDRISTSIDSCCGIFNLDRSSKEVISYLTSPKLVITHKTNDYGEFRSIKGKLINSDTPEKYKIITYLNVGYNWWLKPYTEFPATYIHSDFTWEVPVITGGADASYYLAKLYLVNNEYEGIDELYANAWNPENDNPAIIDSVSVGR